MAGYKADERGPGDLLLDPSEKGKKARAAHEAAKRMLLEAVCCECGKWGTYGSGGLLFCAEHAPWEVVNAAEAFQRRQEAARAK